MTIYGYVRVSTIDQADSGLGLDAQRAQLAAYFELETKRNPGLTAGQVFEDRAITGTRALRQRPAGLALSSTLAAGDTVVFSKIDRGFRSTTDLLNTVEAWQARNIRVVFLDLNVDTATTTGRFMLTVMAAVARFERDRIADRTREGLAAARRRGVRCGVLPQGLRRTGPKGNRKIEVHPELFELGKKIVSWKTAGYTWEGIYWHLKRNEVYRAPNKNDPFHRTREWSMCAIRRLYSGTLKILKWIEEGSVKAPKAKEPPPGTVPA